MPENDHVTDVTNVTTIFRPKTQKRFFESKEDFAGHATTATIGAHDGQSLLRLRMLCKGYPCQSDYTFWEGYTAENKIMG